MANGTELGSIKDGEMREQAEMVAGRPGFFIEKQTGCVRLFGFG